MEHAIKNPLADASNLATILAALRLFQRQYNGHDAAAIRIDWPEHFTAADGSKIPPLGTEDIDTLCEELNS